MDITDPRDTRVWKGQVVNWFCQDDILFHGPHAVMHRMWPFRDAVEVCENVVEVVDKWTYAEYMDKLKKERELWLHM